MQIPGNRLRRIHHVRNVRFPVLVEWCWDTYDDAIHVAKAGKIARRNEFTLGFTGSDKARHVDMFDIALTLLEHENLVPVEVEARHVQAGFTEFNGQRESDVT